MPPPHKAAASQVLSHPAVAAEGFFCGFPLISNECEGLNLPGKFQSSSGENLFRSLIGGLQIPGVKLASAKQDSASDT